MSTLEQEYWTSRENDVYCVYAKDGEKYYTNIFVINIKFKFYLFMLTYEMTLETMGEGERKAWDNADNRMQQITISNANFFSF